MIKYICFRSLKYPVIFTLIVDAVNSSFTVEILRKPYLQRKEQSSKTRKRIVKPSPFRMQTLG